MSFLQVSDESILFDTGVSLFEKYIYTKGEWSLRDQFLDIIDGRVLYVLVEKKCVDGIFGGGTHMAMYNKCFWLYVCMRDICIEKIRLHWNLRDAYAGCRQSRLVEIIAALSTSFMWWRKCLVWIFFIDRTIRGGRNTHAWQLFS